MLVDGLGERFEIINTDIKKWTVGTPIQAPLDAIENLRRKRPFEADDVKEVAVRLAPSVGAVVDNRDIPDICLQHMVAVMLIDKTASFHAAHDKARMKDATVLAAAEQGADMCPMHELTKLLPVRVAVVEITLTDGTRLSDRVEAVRGTPRNPMPRGEVVDKAQRSDRAGGRIGHDAEADRCRAGARNAQGNPGTAACCMSMKVA